MLKVITKTHKVSCYVMPSTKTFNT